MEDKQNNKVDIKHDQDLRRYTISYDDGATPAGYLEYEVYGTDRYFTHTIVKEEYGGRGLAGLLVGEAAKDTSGKGLTIVAECPYVKDWMKKNDYQGDWRNA
ncbi:GNAT family N-acetyltransferase [Corynebacterium lubricantis]|uniref:GNAT family N-acetyltransferase n=1 Tax=Corynebacterium lubricantis TaxID=541095 RepID=UPI00037736E2|nr:GNAT family N-acetyltransferase [Corynebacterium lubricantis]